MDKMLNNKYFGNISDYSLINSSISPILNSLSFIKSSIDSFCKSQKSCPYSYHHENINRANQLNMFTFNRLLFFVILFLNLMNNVNCDSNLPPKIMPFQFNPIKVQEGEKAVASQ